MTSPSPALSCSVCHMFSYSSDCLVIMVHVINDFLFAALEASVRELESWLHTMEANSLAAVASQPPLADAVRHSVAPASCPPAAPKQPGNQGGWITVRKKRSPNSKPTKVHHPPLHLSNRFGPLSDKPLRNKAQY